MFYTQTLLSSSYASPNIRAVVATRKQTSIPTAVGRAKESRVHLALSVSFAIVIQVVEQNQ